MLQEVGPLVTTFGQLGGVVILALCFFLLNRDSLKAFREEMAEERKIGREMNESILERMDTHQALLLERIRETSHSLHEFHNEYRMGEVASGRQTRRPQIGEAQS
jgi:hypothetical protein